MGGGGGGGGGHQSSAPESSVGDVGGAVHRSNLKLVGWKGGRGGGRCGGHQSGGGGGGRRGGVGQGGGPRWEMWGKHQRAVWGCSFKNQTTGPIWLVTGGVAGWARGRRCGVGAQCGSNEGCGGWGEKRAEGVGGGHQRGMRLSIIH